MVALEVVTMAELRVEVLLEAERASVYGDQSMSEGNAKTAPHLTGGFTSGPHVHQSGE